MNTTSYTTNLDLHKTDVALLILRIAVGALMLTHGIPKLYKLFEEQTIAFADPIGIGVEASLTLTVFAEVICSVLLIIGLGTRLASIPLIITMAVAALVVHGADPFQQKEMAIVYLLIYIFLFLTGSGKYSLDHYFLNNKRNRK